MQKKIMPVDSGGLSILNTSDIYANVKPALHSDSQPKH